MLYNLAMILPTDSAFIGAENHQDDQEEKANELFLRQVEITLEMIKNKKWAEKLMADELFYALPKDEQRKIIRIAASDPEGEFINILKILKPVLGEEGLKNILDMIGPDNAFLPLIKQAWD